MVHTLSMVFTLLGTLQFIIPFISQFADAAIRFDTSDYKVLTDRTGGNFSYYAAKCRGELSFSINCYSQKHLGELCILNNKRKEKNLY